MEKSLEVGGLALYLTWNIYELPSYGKAARKQAPHAGKTPGIVELVEDQMFGSRCWCIHRRKIELIEKSLPVKLQRPAIATVAGIYRGGEVSRLYLFT